MIVVYYTSFEAPLHHDTLSAYIASLPDEIKTRLLKFKRWQDAHASLFGKLLLRKGLHDLNMNCNLSGLKYSDFGRPYLENMPDFNISHSGQYVVCAFSTNGKIGIDIEEVQPVCLETFENIFTEEEWRHIKGSKDSDKVFFYYWTAKESIVKAEGCGINIPLNKIYIKNGIASLEGRVWYFKNISLFEDYVIQVASAETINEVCIKKINFQD